MDMSLMTNTGDAATRFTQIGESRYPVSPLSAVFTFARICGILAGQETVK